MTLKQSLLIIVIGLIFITMVFSLIQKHRIRIRYSILWIVISVFFITIPIMMDYYVLIGEMVGIINPISLFFFGAILGLFLLSLQFTLALSVSFYQRKAAIQHTAQLEERVLRLERQLAAAQGDASLQ